MKYEDRARKLNSISDSKPGLVLYWMSRDQRIYDNWSLLFAQNLALQTNSPLIVIFCLDRNYPGATLRSFHFMLKGMQEVEKGLKLLQIPFLLANEDPKKAIPQIISNTNAQALVTDFDPLQIKTGWKENIAKQISIPFYEIDAHNIIPCFKASPKLEFGAYTLRPKIKKLLNAYLYEFPDIEVHPYHKINHTPIDWDNVIKSINCNQKVLPINWILPGEKAAKLALSEFINTKLKYYSAKRNDPTLEYTSNLSPYLHFGHISAQRIALEILKSDAPKDSCEAFLEELIVRRELSDNFCFYNRNYNNFNGLPAWAQKTLNEHRSDTRQYLYSQAQFEKAETHDQAWNAAQKELVIKGKMHGYMRMYWAKKILEWTPSPEEALSVSIYLNDKYALDGRDPNGYVGCMWSVGGAHDRAWAERNVFGKIRFMNEAGLKRKFNTAKYIAMHNNHSINHFF